MTLEIGGQNQNQKKTTTTESRSDRGHGGDRRESRRESRRKNADDKFVSLVDLLRPEASGKAMQPRAENAFKWIQQSLERDPDIIKDHEIRVTAVSREKGHTVKYPGIVITINKPGSNRVAVHTLLLEDGEPLQPLERHTYRGEDITPVPVPSMVWDLDYQIAVQTEVGDLYKDIADVKFASCGVTVVPHTFAIPLITDSNTDANPFDSQFVHVVESLSSFYRWLNRDNTRVKLGEAFNPDKEQLVATVDQQPTVEFDQMGQPRRSDFCISLSVKKRRDEKRDDGPLSYNRDDQVDSGTILRVSGYCLPYYTQPNLDDKKPRNFGINIVVTAIEGKSTPSPELFLYGMACTTVLTNNDMWADGFKPALLHADPHRNLGGLFLEIPNSNGESMERRQYAGVASDEFLDDVDFLFSSDVTISLDCSESGATAWITDLFIQNDLDALEEAADNLTGKEYSDIVDRDVDDVIIRQDTRRFYTGEYNGNHVLRDIRDVDYLYLINFGDDNTALDLAKEWDESLADDTEWGLHQRQMLLQEALGHGGFRITGTVDRAKLDSDFFETVVQALYNMDMLPNVNDIVRGFRPKQRLEASKVKGRMDSTQLGANYRSSSSRSVRRNRRDFRDRG